jgi:hypothetical protein
MQGLDGGEEFSHNFRQAPGKYLGITAYGELESSNPVRGNIFKGICQISIVCRHWLTVVK